MKYRPPTNGVGEVHFLSSYGFNLFFKVIYVKLFELLCVLISKRFYKSKYVYYKINKNHCTTDILRRYRKMLMCM